MYREQGISSWFNTRMTKERTELSSIFLVRSQLSGNVIEFHIISHPE
jgi:hypothetical protein